MLASKRPCDSNRHSSDYHLNCTGPSSSRIPVPRLHPLDYQLPASTNTVHQMPAEVEHSYTFSPVATLEWRSIPRVYQTTHGSGLALGGEFVGSAQTAKRHAVRRLNSGESRRCPPAFSLGRGQRKSAKAESLQPSCRISTGTMLGNKKSSSTGC